MSGRADSEAGERRGIFTPELLDRCIGCGFCLPACPTYLRTGDEASSPRGRIQLMRGLETGVLADDDAIVGEESSFCLGCRACEPVCPAGVQYGALLEEWRDHTWRQRRRPLRLRALLWAADDPRRLGPLGRVRRHAGATDGDGTASLLLGCFERVLYPRVSRAAVQVSPGLRVTPRQGCCGALQAHNGELARGRELAHAVGEALPGTIVTTAGGCAAHLATELGPTRVLELSQWLTTVAAPSLRRRTGLRVALQDSCHLRNGLGVSDAPRRLIGAVAEYVELPSAAECCGAAGTYSLLRPTDSRRILDDKLDEIASADVDVVACVNPGCLRQLQGGLRRRRSRVRALHLVELLAGVGLPPARR